jgi:DNA-binding NarL/FixJ family response regulator
MLEPEFDVLAIFSESKILLTAVPELKPEIVILDIGMPLMNGLEAGKRIKQLSHSVKLVYLTMNTDIEIAAEAFRCGASGYLLKTSGAMELVKALREVLKGNLYISPLVTTDTESFFLNVRLTIKVNEELTGRQREVLQLLAEGRSMKEVGTLLNLTARTVAFHKYRIMERLHIKTNAELVKYAMREHLVSSHQ